MRHKYKALIIIAGLVVGLDQFTKLLILKNIPLYKTIPIIPGFLNLTHFQNPGVAFGLFAGSSSNLQQILLITAALFAISLILYFYLKTSYKLRLMMGGFSLILGGAVGNLIDRFRMNRVVDFIDVYAGNFHWPAFNIADSAISIGMAIFFYYIVFKRPEKYYNDHDKTGI